nr:hypothetical protein Iba_chr14fCG1750 [Ipomoea batatas]
MKVGKTGITRQNLHYPSHGWSVFWTKMGAYQSEIKDKLCFVQIVHIEGGIDCLNYRSLFTSSREFRSQIDGNIPGSVGIHIICGWLRNVRNETRYVYSHMIVINVLELEILDYIKLNRQELFIELCNTRIIREAQVLVSKTSQRLFSRLKNKGKAMPSEISVLWVDREHKSGAEIKSSRLFSTSLTTFFELQRRWISRMTKQLVTRLFCYC